MLNINGSVIATSDINLIANIASKSKTSVIYMGDPIGVPPELNAMNANVVVGVPFVPDYTLLSMCIDGMALEYQNAYIKSLTRYDAEVMIATMIRALMDSNIVLYFPRETIGLGYPELFLKYLTQFGIQTQTKSTAFMYNHYMDNRNLELLIDHGLITVEEAAVMCDDLTAAPQLVDHIIKWYCRMNPTALDGYDLSNLNNKINAIMRNVHKFQNLCTGDLFKPAFSY